MDFLIILQKFNAILLLLCQDEEERFAFRLPCSVSDGDRMNIQKEVSTITPCSMKMQKEFNRGRKMKNTHFIVSFRERKGIKVYEVIRGRTWVLSY